MADVNDLDLKEAHELAESAFDASDPKAVNASRKKAGRHRKRRHEVIRALMDHQDGRAWIYSVLEMCHIYGNPLVQGDPFATHFMIGESNIGRKIMADVIEAAPDQYIIMCREDSDRKRQ